jgi:hypothetical protein
VAGTEDERRQRFAGEIERALSVYRSKAAETDKHERARAVDAIRLRIAVEIRERRRAAGREQPTADFIDDDEVPGADIAAVLSSDAEPDDAAMQLAKRFQLFGAR